MERKGDGKAEQVAGKGRSVGRLQASMQERAWDTQGPSHSGAHAAR